MSVGNMILSSSRLLRVSSAKAILTLQTVIHSLHTVMWWLYCSVFVSMVTVTVSIYSVCFYGYCYCLYAVFVLDTGFHVFVWVGKDATPHEKGGGLVIAHVSSTGTVNLSEVNMYVGVLSVLNIAEC